MSYNQPLPGFYRLARRDLLAIRISSTSKEERFKVLAQLLKEGRLPASRLSNRGFREVMGVK